MREIIELLFLKLSAIYGITWRNLYKSSDFLAFAKDEWLDALGDFTEAEIHKAINICAEHNKYPPTLPEFVSCCKHIRRNNTFNKPEPYAGCAPEIAHAHLAKMKQILSSTTPRRR